MNKKLSNKLIIFIILLSLYQILTHSNTISKIIIESSKIWFYNLVPSILPIYIIIDLLLNYNIYNYITIFLKPISKLFKISNLESFIFLLSIISGFPSNSKYIKNLLDNNTINLTNANKLLIFTHFSNPLFIINSIGINFLHNKKIGIIILISHYLGNIILALITKNSFNNNISNNNFTYKKNSFITTLTNSINNTINILFLLFGIITFFMIITTLINLHINLNPLINSIITGLLEITNGIYQVSNLNINLIYKASLITFFISFGGICIHMQIFSILNKYKLNYFDYLKVRLVHATISSSIVFILLKLLNEF